METLGLVFGATSICTVVQQCLESYLFINKVKGFDHDIKISLAKLTFQKYRLATWAIKLGVARYASAQDSSSTPVFATQDAPGALNLAMGALSNGIDQREDAKFAEHHSTLDERLLDAISTETLDTMLNCILDIVTRADEIATKFKLSRSETEPPAQPSRRFSTSAFTRRSYNPANIPSKVSIVKKIKYFLLDKETLEEMLGHLEFFTDALHAILTPTERRYCEEATLLQIPQREYESFSYIGSSGYTSATRVWSAAGEQIRIETGQDDVNQYIINRQMWENVENEHSHAAFFIDSNRVTASQSIDFGTEPDKSRRFSFGILREEHQQTRVLIELKPYNKDKEMTHLIHRRMNNIVQLLSTPQSKPLQILPTRYFYDAGVDTGPGNTGDMGICYDLPIYTDFAENPISLLQLIEQTDGFTLGDRFRLAIQLVETFVRLHSSNWLHKSFNSSNVLFFPDIRKAQPSKFQRKRRDYVKTVGNLQFDDPKVVGFSYSRPDGLQEITEPVQQTHDPTANSSILYVHFDSLARQRYRKGFDLYSLGCVLLELGFWQPVSHILERNLGEGGDSGSEKYWKNCFVSEARSDELKHCMGDIYSDVVVKLLTEFGRRGPPDDENIGRNLFSLFLQLQRCHA